MSSIAAPLCAHAVAQQASADRKTAFDIPSQPLDSALTRYFEVTGVQLLYDSLLTQGRRSSAVRGRYAPREALRLLLSNTGLVVRYSRANAAIITTPDATTESGQLVPLGRVVVRERVASAALSPVERMAYYEQLETELQSRLRDDRRTARLSFDIVVAFRVDNDGRLEDIRVSRTSGDRKTDSIISETLSGVSVSPPPDLLTQPLRVALKGIRH